MSLKKKTIKGLTWSGFAQGIRQICQFVFTAVLARLLSPDDFGLLGMATVFTGFVTIFNDMGLSGALIQRKEIKEDHLSSIFWLNIFVGIVLTLIMIGASWGIAWFYQKDQLQPILMFISINFFLSSFTIVQQALLTRQMDFKHLAIVETVALILSGVIGITLACHNFGVWSLVYQFLAFTFFKMILLWFLSSWRPRFLFTKQAIKDVFHFSANQTGFEIVNYFARNLDYLVIGKFLGAEALGFYTLAYKLMIYPLQNISWIISKVMFSTLSRVQDDLQKVRRIYMKLVKSISLVTFPMMFGLFALAPEFVLTVFGEQWEPIIPLIRIFCACGVVQSVGTTVGNILLSQGRADLQFKLQLLGTVIVTIAIFIGLQWGTVGVALAYTIQSVFWVHGTLYLATRLIQLDFKVFYASLLNSYFVGLFIFLVILFIKGKIVLEQPLLLISLINIGLFSYAGWLIVTREIVFKDHKVKLAILQ
ncbi:MAG: MOP flippase family protein [Candidatus Omnitrophica bacterium]|nr:MOP flippase family protein [Candidatus Omnitrophota bacterium]MCB9748234.1 MOP flippase family protein [Candidatus Omnitrophota bacterium]